jgi:hypothetical protein
MYDAKVIDQVFELGGDIDKLYERIQWYISEMAQRSTLSQARDAFEGLFIAWEREAIVELRSLISVFKERFAIGSLASWMEEEEITHPLIDRQIILDSITDPRFTSCKDTIYDVYAKIIGRESL